MRAISGLAGVPRRLVVSGLALVLVVALTFGAAGCGGEREIRTQGETEGLYIELGEMLYQVQLSRQLNPVGAEDRGYLRGLPEGTEAPGPGEVWFAIFMRVQNVSDDRQVPAENFTIVDSDEQEYAPILLDPEQNAFAYEPNPVPAGGLIPGADTAASTGPTQGALILFKIEVASLQNRPLELMIVSSRFEAEGTIDLDV